MKRQFGAERSQFSRPDQPAMADPDGVERPIELLLPEGEELHERGKPRREVIVLPDIALQQRGMVGKAVENFSRRQAEPLKLANKFARNAWAVHSLTSVAERQGYARLRSAESLETHKTSLRAQKFNQILSRTRAPRSDRAPGCGKGRRGVDIEARLEPRRRDLQELFGGKAIEQAARAFVPFELHGRRE